MKRNTQTVSASVTPAGGRQVTNNYIRTQGWRDRLLQAKGELSFREVWQLTRTAGNEISHTSIRAVMAGETVGVHSNTLAAICDGLGIDVSWVLTGDVSSRVHVPPGVELRKNPDMTLVPIVSLKHAHAWASLVRREGAENDAIMLPGDARKIRAVRVEDASMSPEYQPGDVLAFKLSTRADDGDVVLAEVEGETVLRRWKPNRDKVLLEPSNARFGSLSVPIKGADIVGHIVGLHRNI